MEEILHRLEQFEFLRIIIFPESIIHEKPIEEWPFCHVLISFHSKGFPLAKTQDYARLHRPFLINDLDKQWDIMDRIQVHEILHDAGIAQPRYGVVRRTLNTGLYSMRIFCRRSNGFLLSLQMEFGKRVRPSMNRMIRLKSMEKFSINHSLKNQSQRKTMMYTSISLRQPAGGSQRLFRKVLENHFKDEHCNSFLFQIGSRSSVYTAENSVRQDGSYIYEEFMPTDGTDVKVYTVGAEYAHAEARKSPGLDGKVERDEFGKEVRYPVILRADEKLIAMKICFGI